MTQTMRNSMSSATLADRFTTVLIIVVFAGLLGNAVLWNQWAYKALSHDNISLEYGEELILSVVLANQNEPFFNIYERNQSPPFMIAPYTPLFYYGVKLFVDANYKSLFGGRLISIVSTVVVSIVISICIFLLTDNIVLSFLGGLLFFSMPVTFKWGVLHRTDNLALLFSVLGLLLYLYSSTADYKTILACSLFFTLAILTKQNIISAFLAVTIHLILKREIRKAFLLSLSVSSLFLISLIVLNSITGGGYYFATFMPINAGNFRLTYGLRMIFQHMLGNIPVALALSFGLFCLLERNLNVIVVYLIVSTVIGVLTIGKLGSAINYFLELTVASCIVIGLLLQEIRTRFARNQLLLITFLVLLITHLAHRSVYANDEVRYHTLDNGATIPEYLNNKMTLADESITATMILKGSKPFLNDSYLFTKLYANGKYRYPIDRLNASLDSMDIDYIVFKKPVKDYSDELSPIIGHTRNKWPKDTLDLIERNYHLICNTGGLYIYAPNEGKRISLR